MADELTPGPGSGPEAGRPWQPSVVGVRFRDSGRVHFFGSADETLDVGTWVACTTSRGQEAGRVVLAPHQVLMSQLDGELKPIDRVLAEDDLNRIEQHRKDASRVVQRAGEISRSSNYGVTVVAADYSLDGGTVTMSFTASDHSFVEDLREMLARELGITVEMRHVGPRDEARLIGGLGKCGRTLYPDVSLGIARNQDLSLNPTRSAELCGRLQCHLSYENEQYRKAKQMLPRLGQRIDTPEGEGIVVSLHVIRELVTVRFSEPFREETFSTAGLVNPGSASAPGLSVRREAASEDPAQTLEGAQ